MSTITASITARAAELLAEWDAAEAAEAARVAAHYAWVDHMVDVERIRRDALPCHHGTAMWPDRGQVCGSCEAEGYDEDPTQEEREAYALQLATREAEAAAQPDPWAGGWDPTAPF